MANCLFLSQRLLAEPVMLSSSPGFQPSHTYTSEYASRIIRATEEQQQSNHQFFLLLGRRSEQSMFTTINAIHSFIHSFFILPIEQSYHNIQMAYFHKYHKYLHFRNAEANVILVLEQHPCSGSVEVL